MFCDVELAARIERAESTLISSACAVVARRVPGALATPLAGGIAAYTEPGSPLNKVAGLGFAGALDAAEIAAVEAFHDARGAPIQVEIATLADPCVAQALTSRGYAMVGVENVLGLGLPARMPERVADGVSVDRVVAADQEAWLDVVAAGFAAPDVEGVPAHEEFPRDVLVRVIGDFTRADGVVLYRARLDGHVVGGASMRTSDGIAQLCGASTLPAARRRGVQSAMLVHRLRDAERSGCSLAVVTTAPGSRSQKNAQKAGFALLYTRVVLRREAR